MLSTQRYLSVTESLLASVGRPPIVASVTVDAVLEPTILSRALTTLAAQYPLLRGQILQDDTGSLLRIAEDQIPGLTIHHGAEDKSKDVVLVEINTPLPLNQQVVRTALSRDGTNSTITLAMDHSVADGRLLVTLIHKLLDNYTILVTGKTPRQTSVADLPPSLETRLAGQFSDEEIAGFITQTVSLAEQFPVVTLPALAAARENTTSFDFAVRNIVFTAQATTEILITAKENGMSAHGLISGVILAALRAQLKPATEPITLAVGSGVDLRHRLIPPVAPDAQQCCASGVSVLVTAPHPTDLIALGRQITTRVHAAINNSDPQKLILAMKHLNAFVTAPASIGVTNLGQLAIPPTPSGIRVIANRILGPSKGSIPLIYVNTTDGRLTLDLAYNRSFLTDQQMTDLANGIEWAVKLTV